MCTRCTKYSSFVLFFCGSYLYNVHLKECTFDIFDNPILQAKKELKNLEIQEQTASQVLSMGK